MNSAHSAAMPRLLPIPPPPKKKSPRGKPRLVRRPPRQQPALRVTPYAWAKLVYLRDAGPTEIGGFGISAPGDALLIEDVRLVRQSCDWASVAFDDQAVAEFFDEQVDQGRRPAEFGRVWVHTHPGDSPSPSSTDEETFARVFGGCDWAVMLILAAGGASYARLRFSAGPGDSLVVPVELAFEAPFEGSDQQAWQEEYDACVTPLTKVTAAADAGRPASGADDPYWDAPLGWFDDMPGAETVSWREEAADERWW
jgi:proteasome lid subunit RPN8/RPN11